MKTYLSSVITILILLSGCAQSVLSGNPPWVDTLIQQIENDPVGNPPLSVWRYEYKGQKVYFVPAHCCDIPGILFNTEGNVLCEPDDGIKGVGDERCSDFFDLRTHEQLIWQDTR